MTKPPIEDVIVRSVQRAFLVLRSFGPTDQGLPLRQIAQRAGLDKATTRRLLRTLIADGLMTQRHADRDYSLGLGVLELASAAPLESLRQQAQPLLAQLSGSTGATAYLVVPFNGSALCVETMAGDGNAPPRLPVGTRLPLHASSAARVLLAYLPADERRQLLAAPLPALTQATPTDPAELAAMLDRIRERGWEASAGHTVEGLASLAVPVRNAAGDVIASVGLTTHDSHLFDGERPRHLDHLLGAVRDWEQRFTDSPSRPPDLPAFLALASDLTIPAV